MMHLQSVSLLACGGERPQCLGSTGTVSPEIEQMVHLHCREVPAVPEPFLLGAGPGASLLVPLYAEGTMAGFLCLGPKRNGEPFSSENLTLLRTLSGHLAAALRSAQLAQELRAKVGVLDALNARVERAQEEERARLAAELHDEPLQTALHLQRSIAAEGTGRAATEQHLLLSERIVLQLRSLYMEVRPAALDELGIAAALELLTTDLEQHAGVPILLHADSDVDDLRLPSHAELALYRAAQEALNNALKHARPSTLRVCLEHRDGSVLLIVEDDGTGFDVQESSGSLLAAGHLGLAGLRQRIERVGGSLEVTSRPAAGTCVQVRLPVEDGST
jgi:signal transduction histidine kinase